MTYLWLDPSQIWNRPPGQRVATYVKNRTVLCLFNWDYPITSDPFAHFAKTIELPYGPWYPPPSGPEEATTA